MTAAQYSHRREDVFVGRDRELGKLTAALDDAITSRGRLVMLVGEPGIGKTRLAEEIAAIARGRGAEVLWGRCPEALGAPPYWPWSQALRTLVSRGEAGGTKQTPGNSQPYLALITPETGQRIGDPPGTQPTESPEAARFRLFDSVTEFLKAAARERAVLLIFDDLHWADASSLGMLEFFVSAITDSRILVVGTYRDVEVDRGHPLFHALGGLSRQRTFARVLVRQLTRRDVEALVAAATSARPPRSLSTLVYEYTAGNPLFVRELVRFLDEEGLLTEAHVADLQRGDSRLPEGIREVIGRRMDRLSKPCNEVMRVASVIGPEFSTDLVRLVVAFPQSGERSEPGPAGQPERTQPEPAVGLRVSRATRGDPLLEALDSAVVARIIERVPGTPGNYRFTHALLQRTLQDEIPQTRRRQLHALLAEALEALYGVHASEHAGEIAKHLSDADALYEPEKLMGYSVLAGEQALDSLGFQEAANYFEIAERAAVEIRRTAEAQAQWGPETERGHEVRMAEIWYGLAKARIGTAALREDRQQAWNTLARAFNSYVALGEKQKAAEVARTPMAFGRIKGLVDVTERAVRLVEPDSPEAGFLLARHAVALLDERGDLNGTRSALNEALLVANRHKEQRLEALAHVHLSHVAFAECDYKTCIQEGLKTLRPGGGADDQIAGSVYCFVIPAMIASGDLESPQAMTDALRKMSSRLRVTLWLGQAPLCMWALAFASGDRKAMQKAREELTGWSDESAATVAAFMEASELLTMGPTDRCAEILRSTTTGLNLNYFQTVAVIGILAPAAHRLNDPALLSATELLAREMLSDHPLLPREARPAQEGLGFVAAARGDAVAATRSYQEVMPSKGRFSQYAGFSVDRLLGLLAATMGDVPAAEGHFEDAVRSCQKAGFLPELAWACHDHAELLLARGAGPSRQRAGQLIQEGEAVATDLGMRPLIDSLAALRSKATATPPGRPVFPAGLSEREVEVLRLIAAGSSNAQIAKALVITPNTAATHVHNILTKIGAANRTEAATYANKHGLVS